MVLSPFFILLGDEVIGVAEKLSEITLCEADWL